MTSVPRFVPRIVAAALLAVTLLLSHPAATDPGPAAQAEIDYLLQFVAASPCTFVRNDVAYPAAEARKHLEEKLRVARRRISTAEDFIRGLASSSSMSGKPYLIRCGLQEVAAGVWLTDELRRFRARAPDSAKSP
jgi:hypothetical protein